MKTIIKIFLVVLTFFISIGVSYGYTTTIDLKVEVLDGETPVVDKAIGYIEGEVVGEKKMFLTDSKGEITTTFQYNSDIGNKFIFLIDQNRVSVSKFEPQNIETIKIDYNREKGEIMGVTGIIGGEKRISNQEILRSSNYKLLLLYIFGTILIFTIFGGGKYIYGYLYQDVNKHIRY